MPSKPVKVDMGVSEEEIKDISLKEDNFYKTSEFLEKFEEFYDNYEALPVVAKKLSEHFNKTITKETLSRLRKQQIALRLKEDKGDKFFDNNYRRMKKRWEDAWEMVGDLVTDYKTVRAVIKSSKLDDYSKALQLLSKTPQVIAIVGEIRKQLEFIQKQTEEMNNYQQNNLQINIVQFNQEFKKVLNKLGMEEIKALFESTNNPELKLLAREIN